MKKLLYTVALTALSFTVSYAQKMDKKRATVEERAQKYAANLQTKLNLTDDQKVKVEKLELERFKKFEAARIKDSVAFKAKMDARKAEAKAHEEKLNKILNKEQQQKLAAEKAELRKKIGERLKNHNKHRGGKKNFGDRKDKSKMEKSGTSM